MPTARRDELPALFQDGLAFTADRLHLRQPAAASSGRSVAPQPRKEKEEKAVAKAGKSEKGKRKGSGVATAEPLLQSVAVEQPAAVAVRATPSGGGGKWVHVPT